MSILHPLTPRLTTRHSLLVILGIWAVSLVITCPDMAIIQYEANISSGAQCFVCELNVIHNYIKSCVRLSMSNIMLYDLDTPSQGSDTEINI